MRWPRLLAGALTTVVTVALVAGCSSGGTSGGTTGPPASTQTNDAAAITTAPTPTSAAKDLHGKLLTLADLPAGWSVDSSESNSTSCIKDSTAKIPGKVARAEASFAVDPDEGPFLAEQAAVFQDPDAAFEEIPAAVARCAQFSGENSGVHYEFTVAPMSFRPVGDRSVAYRISVKASQGSASVTFPVFAVVFERNGLIGDVTYGGLDVDRGEFTPLAVKAASKF